METIEITTRSDFAHWAIERAQEIVRSEGSLCSDNIDDVAKLRAAFDQLSSREREIMERV